jgi:hypothetical protein
MTLSKNLIKNVHGTYNCAKTDPKERRKALKEAIQSRCYLESKEAQKARSLFGFEKTYVQ